MALANTAVVGLGPSLSMSMTYAAMADSIGIIMHNAAVAEQHMQTISTAATVQVCALIIAKGAAPAS
ncbi:killing trait family protein [Desulfovibrio ferrophilus]|uniref:Killing trait family protein n=1 Tax=Desulfovibrio ferrophilus TaxID=241368 RepID=A0A2Z6B3G4_9BACT|nr:killing trait family protein [Desulfovibrio ferrophilus]